MVNYTLLPDPPPDNPDRLIGEEWALKGVGQYQFFDPPPACIIDGTPLNACTKETH